MADPNLAQNPDDLTGRDRYIVCLALTYASYLNTSLARRRSEPLPSDCRDFRTLLRTYPPWMIAAAHRSAFSTIVGEAMTEEQLARDLAALGVEGEP